MHRAMTDTHQPTPPEEAGLESDRVERSCFDDGVNAFRQGDFAVAARLLLPIAGSHSAYRQPASRYLACMYATGLGGLPKDRGTARYWSAVADRSVARRVLDYVLEPVWLLRATPR